MTSKKMWQTYKDYVLPIAPFRHPILSRAKGSFYEDIEGNHYLDMMSGQFCAVLGHANDDFCRKLNQQTKKIIHTNTLSMTEEVLEALKKLSEINDQSLKKGILLSTGAEAIEAAIRYAKVITGKPGIVGINAGYHGLTLATQSISQGGVFAIPKVPESFLIPTPDYWDNHLKEESEPDFIARVLKESDRVLSSLIGHLAAFVIEPVISVGGMIFPSKKYFQGIKKLADKHGALVIFDECQTGMGRLGTWFGYNDTGVVPDILVLAKAVGLGLPVSAVVFSEAAVERLSDKALHFSSHQNDAISGFTLTYLIDYINEHHLLTEIKEKGESLLMGLKKLQAKHSLMINPRGKGLMLGFDLKSPEISQPNPMGLELIELMQKKGVIVQAVRRGRTVRLLPPYTISKAEIELFLNTLDESLAILGKRHENEKL